MSRENLAFILHGAYDDTHTISDVISRTGEVKSSWNYSAPPISETGTMQNLFDTPEEAEEAAKLIFSILSGKKLNQEEQSIHDRWCAEVDLIGAYHKKYFWPKLSPFRREAGFPNE